MKLKLLLTLMLGVGLIGCFEKGATTERYSTPFIEAPLDIPYITIDKSQLFYVRKKSVWTFKNQLYSGYAISYYEDGNPKEKFGILEGRKQNQAIEWYPDGHYKRLTNYLDGKLSGDKKVWSSDSSHILLSHLQYDKGKLHGEQKKWYPSGELFQKLNFDTGKEEGLQQAFRKNGALFANYEAREGQVFGLKRATLCYGLSAETILSND
ncbi:MAG: membrane-binding protein [Cyclobacteriaceae bacterium]